MGVRVSALLGCAAAIGIGIPASGTQRASHCSLAAVVAHECVAETTYARSPGSGSPSSGHLLGFFSSMSYYAQKGSYRGIDDAWERARIADIGGNAQRWLISWQSVQPSGTRPAFLDQPLGKVHDRDPVSHAVAVSDARYLELLGAGMVPVIGVYDTPWWATALTAGAHRNVPDLRDWDAFVRALAKRYPDAVLEGYNEPNVVLHGRAGAAIPAADMAAMQIHMHAVAHGVNAGQTVLGPALGVTAPHSPTWGIAGYAAALYKHGVKGAMDGFSVHVYPGGSVRSPSDLDRPDNGFTATFAAVRQAMAAAGDHVPLYVTEIGVTTTGPDRVPSEAAQQQVLLAMHRRMLAMPDVRAELYFAMRDGAAPEMRRSSSDYGLGWLHADQASRPGDAATPKPVFCAFAHAAGTSYPGC